MTKKLLFMAFVVLVGMLVAEPERGFCVYCSGGGPCYSNVDCSEGCRCQSPPYMQGVCVPAY